MAVSKRTCPKCGHNWQVKHKPLKISLGKRMDNFVARADTSIQAVSTFCRETIAALGTVEDIRPAIATVLDQEAWSAHSKAELMMAYRKCQLLQTLLFCLAGLEDAILRDAENRIVLKKTLRELSTEEHRDIIEDAASKLVSQNPQLAVMSLERAGFDVILTKKGAR